MTDITNLLRIMQKCDNVVNSGVWAIEDKSMSGAPNAFYNGRCQFPYNIEESRVGIRRVWMLTDGARCCQGLTSIT